MTEAIGWGGVEQGPSLPLGEWLTIEGDSSRRRCAKGGGLGGGLAGWPYTIILGLSGRRPQRVVFFGQKKPK
jgi:hypothetical protein